jgi:hypothetical protein
MPESQGLAKKLQREATMGWAMKLGKEKQSKARQDMAKQNKIIR